jgi:autotransporter-associated beta strand protein
VVVNNTVNIGSALNVQGSQDLTLGGAITGAGSLTKSGGNILSLTGTSNFTGSTSVNAGTLRVNGSLGSGSVAVASGGAVDGAGTLAGAVSVANGGTLRLNSGSVLTLGSLVLNDTSNVEAMLGAAVPGAAGLIKVTGNLTLDGRLNIADNGGFGIGVYRLFDYDGLLTNNELLIVGMPVGVPANELEVQTSVDKQVNLVVGGDASIRFWDGAGMVGNGSVQGGAGTWNSSNSNWTTTLAGLNLAWNSSFAVFQNTAGVVTVDGTHSVTGLQFLTDGYRLNGGVAGQLLLSNAASAIRVDTGITATLGVNLGGSGGLNKLQGGTLVLDGSNSYSGDTLVSGGTLRVNGSVGNGAVTVASGATLAGTGSLGGAVSIAGNGTAEFTKCTFTDNSAANMGVSSQKTWGHLSKH